MVDLPAEDEVVLLRRIVERLLLVGRTAVSLAALIA